ncbi:hypothetical protein SLE2022_036360 [Rubroshorea leprosula]
MDHSGLRNVLTAADTRQNTCRMRTSFSHPIEEVQISLKTNAFSPQIVILQIHLKTQTRVFSPYHQVFSHIFKASSSIGFSSVSASSPLSCVFSSAYLVPRHRFEELEVIVSGGTNPQGHKLNWGACTWFQKS